MQENNKIQGIEKCQERQWLSISSPKTGHEFDFDHTEILQQDKNYWRRLILEGKEIKPC